MDTTFCFYWESMATSNMQDKWLEQICLQTIYVIRRNKTSLICALVIDKISEDYFNFSFPGARPTKHISIEFEIRWKFKTL